MNTAKGTPSLPDVKKNIRALLISAPRGLTVEDIEHDYQAVLGKPLPFEHFRCKNALEFLKTMPDVVAPTWNNGILILKGIADESSRHIARLVSRQRVNSSKSRRLLKAPVSTKPLVVPDRFRRNIKELLSVYPNGVLGSALTRAYVRHYGEELSYVKLGFKSMSQLLNAIQDIATIVKKSNGEYRVVGVLRKTKSKTVPTVPVKATSLLPAPSKPPPPRPSTSKPQSPLLTRALSKIQAQKSAANVIHSQRAPPTDLNSLEGDVSIEKDQNQTNVEKVKALLDSKSGVSECMKKELISVLAKRPNGVWAARLPFEYKTLLCKELNVLANGFYSIIEMASAMPDIFRIERPFSNGDWLLFLAAKCRKDNNLTKVNVPENAVGKGVGYSQETVPEEFFIELYVTHVRTPDCFWIQLMKNEEELTNLQTNMREFYSSKESATFMVDDSLVKLGQVCVARFPVDREWYRGLITATPSQRNVVEVFYVDYGNSSQVSKSDIRLVRKDFFQLPSQAIKCKLANVTPKMSKWDPKAAFRLDELTANKGLVGNALKNKKNDVLNLFLCDTNGKDDIHINDKLVEEGFAVFKRVNGHTTPPGLPPPEAIQAEINQEIMLNTCNPPSSMTAAPTFPDYSIPLFPPFPYDLSMPFTNPNMPVIEPTVPQMKEEISPMDMDEEKPTEEDLEFMRQVCEELADASDVVVKRLNLPGEKVIHVIKFEEKPYVVRSEISALLWDSDILRTRLQQIKKVVEKEVISREDHEELFEELRRLDVGNFGGEEVKQYASLYPLSTVPEILECFGCASAELVTMVKNEFAAYEKSPGTYWSDENNNMEEGADNSGQSEAEDEHDLEALKLAEQALQFARKRLLRAMTNAECPPSEEIVDEAAGVEKRLEHVRELITVAVLKDAAKGIDLSTESAQPGPRQGKPVGVTRPEVRRGSPENNLIHLTPDVPSDIPSIPIPAPQYSIPSPSQNPDTTTSTSLLLCSNTSTSTSQYPDIPPSSSSYPDTATSAPQPVNINTIPQNPTEITRSPVDNEGSNGVYPGTSVDNEGSNGVYSGTSVDNQQAYKDLVESARQRIERISSNNMTQRGIEPVSSWRSTRSSSQAHHVMLPPSNQPLGHFPFLMHGGHVTPLHHLNVPLPLNVQFLGPLHHIPSPHPYSELMHLNGPLSAPNLLNPSQLLYQYGSPFPGNHQRRGQR